MISKNSFPAFVFAALLICGTAFSQTPTGKVIDNARVFVGEDAEAAKSALEREFAEIGLETGATLIFKTESLATGSSAEEIAQQSVAELLPGKMTGAVMVLVRSDRSVALAVSEGSSAIPDYVFTNIKKAPGSGEGVELHEYALRSGREMATVFRKYFAPDSGKLDPRVKGDRILMLVVCCVIFLLVLGFAWIQWRGQE